MHHVWYMNTTHAASALHASVIHPYNNPMHFTSTDVSYYLNLYASRQKKRSSRYKMHYCIWNSKIIKFQLEHCWQHNRKLITSADASIPESIKFMCMTIMCNNWTTTIMCLHRKIKSSGFSRCYAPISVFNNSSSVSKLSSPLRILQYITLFGRKPIYRSVQKSITCPTSAKKIK